MLRDSPAFITELQLKTLNKHSHKMTSSVVRARRSWFILFSFCSCHVLFRGCGCQNVFDLSSARKTTWHNLWVCKTLSHMTAYTASVTATGVIRCPRSEALFCASSVFLPEWYCIVIRIVCFIYTRIKAPIGKNMLSTILNISILWNALTIQKKPTQAIQTN